MSTTAAIQRIETDLHGLTTRVNALKAQLAPMKLKSSDHDDWIGRISGSFKDDPGYDEIIELGRQNRKSDFS